MSHKSSGGLADVGDPSGGSGSDIVEEALFVQCRRIGLVEMMSMECIILSAFKKAKCTRADKLTATLSKLGIRTFLAPR